MSSSLTAKQIQAAQVAADIAKWEAEGNRAKQVTGHAVTAVKPAPFNKALAPRMSAMFERGENHRANIVEFIRKAGAPVTCVEIAEHMGMLPDTAQWHVRILCNNGVIKIAHRRGNTRLYQLSKGHD